MGISLRIGRDARQQINHAVRTAEEQQETAKDSTPTNTSPTTHEGVAQ